MATRPGLAPTPQGLAQEPQAPFDYTKQRIPAFENFEIGTTENPLDYNVGGLARLAQYGRLNDNYDAFNQVAKAYGFTPELQSQASDIGALLTNAYLSPSHSFFQRALRPTLGAAFPQFAPALYGKQAGRTIGVPEDIAQQLGSTVAFGTAAPLGNLGTRALDRMGQPGSQGYGAGQQDIAALQGQAQETNQQWNQLARQIGGSQRELASRGLGGASPQFLARMSSQDAGTPQLDAYGLVQQYLSQQQR